MADLMNMAASAAGGGVFGLIGSLVGRAAGLVEQRQTFAQERARWQHEEKIAELDEVARQQAATADLALAREEGRMTGLAASIAAEAAIGESYNWVNAVRALTRPCLTLLLWLITFGVFLRADALDRAAIIETVTFAATAATLWWFGDRGQQMMRR